MLIQIVLKAMEEQEAETDYFKWTIGKVIWAIFLFVLAGEYHLVFSICNDNLIEKNYCDSMNLMRYCLSLGLAEIIGGWMVWSSIRGSVYSHGNVDDGEVNLYKKKPWWFAIIGSFLLILYGFLPCLQPMDSFGRIYAVYGGFFIVLSFLFGWVLDGDKPDLGDVVGGSVAIVGVFMVMLWPRNES